MVNAGVKENVVPQRAEAKVNFRLLPGDTPESVVEYITSIVDDPQIEISYERWGRVPGVSETDSRWLQCRCTPWRPFTGTAG